MSARQRGFADVACISCFLVKVFMAQTFASEIGKGKLGYTFHDAELATGRG